MNAEEKAKIENAYKDLPGVSIDNADDETVDQTLVEERTKTENNNPRNNDDAMPVNPK